MRRLAMILTGAATFWAAAVFTAVSGERLVLLQEYGCFWCAHWDKEIADIYPNTAKGQLAPPRRLDIHNPLPDDPDLAHLAVFTPTFTLVRDGHELARIEGYPGEDFYWGLLSVVLKENINFDEATQTPRPRKSKSNTESGKG